MRHEDMMKCQLNATDSDSHNNNNHALRCLVDSCVVGAAPLLNLRFIGFHPFLKGVGSVDAGRNGRAYFSYIAFKLVPPKIRMKGTKQRLSIILRQACKGQKLRPTILQGKGFP